MSPLGGLARGALLAGGAGLAAFGYGALVERHAYRIRHVVLPVLRRPGRLRVLLFADLHLMPGQERRLAFVRRAVEETEPDVLVSGGDQLEAPQLVDEVVGLHADVLGGRLGLAVLGAHDFWGPARRNPLRYLFEPADRAYGVPQDTRAYVDGLAAAGWQVVDNRRIVADTPVGAVDVTGLGDPHIGYDQPSAVSWEPPEDDVAVRLGIVHAPYRDALARFDRAGFDAVLSGHTHGGQVCVPGWGALVTNTDLPTELARGTFIAGADLPVHVSAGLGHSQYAPFRFACPPELSVIDLVG